MVFVTDGEPNRYINSSGYVAGYQESVTTVREQTRQAFIRFAQQFPDVEVYIVGISKGANSGTAYQTLTSIASSIGATYYVSDDAERLRESLLNIVEHCTNVEITDKLLKSIIEFFEDYKLQLDDSD